jgi:HlyD family secretion protein
MAGLPRASLTRRRVTAVATLALAGGAVAFALLSGGGHHAAKGAVAAADRGDVIVTVRGVGRISAGSGGVTIGASSAQVGGQSGGPGNQSSTTSAASSSKNSGSGGAAVPADAILPATSGRVERLLVTTGDRVSRGTPIAVLSDDGTAHAATVQAQSDFQSAQLELAQLRVHDPANGAPATASELAAARAGIVAARTEIAAARRPASHVEVTAAALEVTKAQQDLERSSAEAGPAIASAQTSVALATQKLAELGSPNPVDVAAAQLDVEKAQLELQNLQHSEPSPNATALSAANLAVVVAQRKLAAVTAPPSAAAVSAAQLDLHKAKLELATATEQYGKAATMAAHSALVLARERLAALAHHPAATVVSVAEREFRRAEADLVSLKLRGGPGTATAVQLAQLKADIAQQRLTLASELERRLTVTATSSGTITSVMTAPGATVDPTTPVGRIDDLEHVTVTVELSEFDVARAGRGDEATVSVDALGGTPVAGRVSDIALVGNNNNGVVTFPVTVALTHASNLRIGMGASVKIVVARRHNVVRVPLDAVNQEGGSATVTVVKPSGATEQRDVQLGLSDDSHAEVVHGLAPGEKVLAAQSSNGP